MSKIAIFGSSVDNFLKSHYDLSMVEKIVHEKINLFALPNDYIYSTGEIGIPSMALDFPSRKGIFIPVSPDVFCRDWPSKDCLKFGYQLRGADFITITNSSFDGMGHIVKMLKDSDLVISFWVGERVGFTFEQMLLALNMGIKIHHGLDDIIIDQDVLMRGWENKTKKEY